MAKYSAEELSSRINELEIDDDVKIALMEDITDSITPEESEELASLQAEIERVTGELVDLKEKYKARFMSAVASDEVKEETDDVESGEYQETEVIDVKEI